MKIWTEIGDDGFYRAKRANMRGLGGVRGADVHEFANNLLRIVVAAAPWMDTVYIYWPDGKCSDIDLWPKDDALPQANVIVFSDADGQFFPYRTDFPGLEEVRGTSRDEFEINLMDRIREVRPGYDKVIYLTWPDGRETTLDLGASVNMIYRRDIRK